MPDTTPETLLRNLGTRRSPEVMALGCRLRDIVRHAAHVNLGFYRGAGLPNAEGLPCGDGKLIRHIQVRSVFDLKAALFRRLIRPALTE